MHIAFHQWSLDSHFMTTMAITRVLLADDDSLVRLAIRRVLAGYPEVEVVGEAATGVEAVSSVERLRPHIVIMDIRMPRMDGIAACREVKDKYPDVQVIGLSEYAYGYHADAMLKAGALAVYQKSNALEELYAAIKKVIGSQDNPEPST
jgi:DNA-binding NarL/FixJ family response regulator